MNVRSSYPIEMSLILLTGIFLFSCFFSYTLFDVPFHEAEKRETIYFGMFLIGIAVILATLVLWDEILFHVTLTSIEDDGLLFRNNQYKLLFQIFIYLGIPSIFGYVYINYEINHLYFILWLVVCMGLPLIKKIKSGIENYYDFLKLTHSGIEYKNNEKGGRFPIEQLESIRIIKNKETMTEKIELKTNIDTIIIDLNEMELDDFFGPIEDYINAHYQKLIIN